MPSSMKLTDAIVADAKPRQKIYKLFDGHCLYLLIHPNGGRYWRLDYRFAGKRRTKSLGVYPVVSLAEARLKRDDFKLQLKTNQINPSNLIKLGSFTDAELIAELKRRKLINF